MSKNMLNTKQPQTGQDEQAEIKNRDSQPSPQIFFYNPYPLDFKRASQEACYGTIVALALIPVKYSFSSPNKFFPHPASLTPKNIFRACMWAPIKEEIIFRGLIMPVFEEALKAGEVSSDRAKIGAVVISSGIFALTHKRGRPLKILAGITYGSLTYLYDSLWASTAAHMTNNTVVVAGSKLLRR